MERPGARRREGTGESSNGKRLTKYGMRVVDRGRAGSGRSASQRHGAQDLQVIQAIGGRVSLGQIASSATSVIRCPDQNRSGRWPRLNLITRLNAADVWRRLQTNGSALSHRSHYCQKPKAQCPMPFTSYPAVIAGTLFGLCSGL